MAKVLSVRYPKIHEMTLEDVERSLGGLRPMAPQPERSAGIVIFTGEARAELFQQIHWNQVHPNNQKEQQVMLAGYVCCDPGRNCYFIIVCFCLYAYCSDRSPVRAGQGEGERQALVEGQILNELEVINSEEHPTDINPFYRRLGKVGLVGKLHTHPGMGLFLSGTDRLGHANANKFWVDIVANPLPPDCGLAAFGGPAARKCEIFAAAGKERTGAEMRDQDGNWEYMVIRMPAGKNYKICRSFGKLRIRCHRDAVLLHPNRLKNGTIPGKGEQI